jgi:hypothetical protein
MFIRLAHCHTKVIDRTEPGTHRYQERAAEETVPRIFGVIDKSMIKENWPLISSNTHFTAPKLLLDPDAE